MKGFARLLLTNNAITLLISLKILSETKVKNIAYAVYRLYFFIKVVAKIFVKEVAVTIVELCCWLILCKNAQGEALRVSSRNCITLLQN